MKVMNIEGMSCGNCKNHVEKALNAIDGVSATVDLKDNSATIELAKDVDNSVLTKAVEDAGYTVLGFK